MVKFVFTIVLFKKRKCAKIPQNFQDGVSLLTFGWTQQDFHSPPCKFHSFLKHALPVDFDQICLHLTF